VPGVSQVIQPVSISILNSRAARVRQACKRTGLAALMLAFVAGSPASAEDREAPNAPMHNTWYATTITQSVSGFVFTHFWSKGVSMRSEVIISGRRLVTIVTPTHYYTLDLTRGTGIGVERSDLARASDANRVRPFADEHAAILRGGGEFVAEEELANQKVDMYRLTNDSGRIQLWVTKNLNLPVRIERWDRESGRRNHIDYVDWLRGFPIADSFFEPPTGVDIEMFGYGEYVSRAMSEPLGPAPAMFGHLLHGEHLQGGETSPAPESAAMPTAEPSSN
jgi:hypothetical protein